MRERYKGFVNRPTKETKVDKEDEYKLTDYDKSFLNPNHSKEYLDEHVKKIEDDLKMKYG